MGLLTMLFVYALAKIMPGCPDPVKYAPALASAMVEGNINSVTRAAAFIGQIALESGELRYWEELSDGVQYENRRDLGNTQPGDGRKYKGRGPIQLTGRDNYLRCGEALGIDLLNNPELAATPEHGFRIAAWFWNSRDLNTKADAMDYRQVTRTVNGGLSHHDRRLEYYRRALEVLGVDAPLSAS